MQANRPVRALLEDLAVQLSRTAAIILSFSAVSLATGLPAQQAPVPYSIDATVTAPEPETGFLRLGGVSPSGVPVRINSRYLSIGDKPVLPVMGEFHFSRYPEEYWEEELQKMKAGGVSVVATYLFWNHHEEIEGQFDWEGRRNLRRFVELCQRNGLYVYLRIGPWAHGEMRNGGYPDWLVAKKLALHTNDPEYLKYVARYFTQVGVQLHGLSWQQGGPILGVQLENEYNLTGPGAGAEHIGALKRIVLAAGINPPLFSVFSGNQEFPAGEALPFVGGYPDKFWAPGMAELPPSGLYTFDAPLPSSTDMGGSPALNIAGNAVQGAVAHPEKTHHYPLFSSELAGGMVASYRRRTLLQANDVAALTLTRLGSGVNLYGYYMFHDGTNPIGKLSTLNESFSCGGGNDLAVLSYAFNAPLGEFGQERESFRKLKSLHYFLRSFGADLAPMTTYLLEKRPAGSGDNSVARIALRASGDSGFLFVNNYARKLPMPERHGFQVKVQLPSQTVTIPEKPVDVPADSYFIWPVNLKVGDSVLRSSTAQLLSRFESGGTATYFFFAIPGIAPEFTFESSSTASAHASNGTVHAANDVTIVDGLTAGKDTAIEIAGKSGRRARIVLLTKAEAGDFWQLTAGSEQTAFLSPADVFVGADGIHLRSTDPARLKSLTYLSIAKGNQLWEQQDWKVKPRAESLQWVQTRDADPRPALHIEAKGSKRSLVPIQPADSDFAGAAAWTLNIPAQPMAGLSDIFLRIHYAGDVARVYDGNRLLADNFFNGNAWEIGLKRFLPGISSRELTIKVLPMPKNNLIYLEPFAQAMMNPTAQTGQITGIEFLPEYEVVFQSSHEAGSMRAQRRP